MSRRHQVRVFGSELSDDMATITGLNRDQCTGPDPDIFAYAPR